VASTRPCPHVVLRASSSMKRTPPRFPIPRSASCERMRARCKWRSCARERERAVISAQSNRRAHGGCATAVRGLPRKRQLGASPVELCAPLDHCVMYFGPSSTAELPLRAAQSVARLDGVLLVQADLVFVAQRPAMPPCATTRESLKSTSPALHTAASLSSIAARDQDSRAYDNIAAR